MVPLRLASRPSNDQQPCAAYWIAPPPTDAKNRILKSVLEGLRLTGLRLLNKQRIDRGSLPYATKKIIAQSANRHTGRLSPSEVGASRVIFFLGTLLPFLRALESAMAIACLRLFTLPPFPPLPLFALPLL
jgi:hypothetical protein